MKKLMMFVFLVAIVALPAGVQVSADQTAPEQLADTLQKLPPGKEKKTPPMDLPEPSMMLLVGAAAAGLVGVRKLLHSKRR